jgi:hypothetical protein
MYLCTSSPYILLLYMLAICSKRKYNLSQINVWLISFKLIVAASGVKQSKVPLGSNISPAIV